MSTYSDDTAAVRALVAQLEAQFGGAAYAAHYRDTNGVALIVRDDKPLPQQRGKQPCILFSVDEAADDAEWSSARSEFRMVTLNADIHAGDEAGAKVGNSNPTGIDETLAADLVQEIKTNYATYRDLGLMGIQVRASQGQVRQQERGGVTAPYAGDTGPMEHERPHRITFRYERA